MLRHLLEELVGHKIILILVIARSGLVIHKSSYRGILRGRPCKRNFNNCDLFAVRAEEGSITYLDPHVFDSDKDYMVTLEQTDALGSSGLPILYITFNPR